jgi:hypothetical protein
MKTLVYEKTGTVKSKRKDIYRSTFKEMPTSSIIYGALSEIWSRYSTEILAFLLFGSWAMYIWNQLG